MARQQCRWAALASSRRRDLTQASSRPRAGPNLFSSRSFAYFVLLRTRRCADRRVARRRWSLRLALAGGFERTLHEPAVELHELTCLFQVVVSSVLEPLPLKGEYLGKA